MRKQLIHLGPYARTQSLTLFLIILQSFFLSRPWNMKTRACSHTFEIWNHHRWWFQASLSFDLPVTEISPCQRSATLKFNIPWSSYSGRHGANRRNVQQPDNSWWPLDLSEVPFPRQEPSTPLGLLPISGCQGALPSQPTPHCGKSLFLGKLRLKSHY